jgi:hypothetical protein
MKKLLFLILALISLNKAQDVTTKTTKAPIVASSSNFGSLSSILKDWLSTIINRIKEVFAKKPGINKDLQESAFKVWESNIPQLSEQLTSDSSFEQQEAASLIKQTSTDTGISTSDLLKEIAKIKSIPEATLHNLNLSLTDNEISQISAIKPSLNEGEVAALVETVATQVINEEQDTGSGVSGENIAQSITETIEGLRNNGVEIPEQTQSQIDGLNRSLEGTTSITPDILQTLIERTLPRSNQQEAFTQMAQDMSTEDVTESLKNTLIRNAEQAETYKGFKDALQTLKNLNITEPTSELPSPTLIKNITIEQLEELNSNGLIDEDDLNLLSNIKKLSQATNFDELKTVLESLKTEIKSEDIEILVTQYNSDAKTILTPENIEILQNEDIFTKPSLQETKVNILTQVEDAIDNKSASELESALNLAKENDILDSAMEQIINKNLFSSGKENLSFLNEQDIENLVNEDLITTDQATLIKLDVLPKTTASEIIYSGQASELTPEQISLLESSGAITSDEGELIQAQAEVVTDTKSFLQSKLSSLRSKIGDADDPLEQVYEDVEAQMGQNPSLHETLQAIENLPKADTAIRQNLLQSIKESQSLKKVSELTPKSERGALQSTSPELSSLLERASSYRGTPKIDATLEQQTSPAATKIIRDYANKINSDIYTIEGKSGKYYFKEAGVWKEGVIEDNELNTTNVEDEETINELDSQHTYDEGVAPENFE